MSYIPSTGSGGGWTTAYSADFSAMSTGGSAVLADGANTLDGKTWYVENAANADELRIVNSEGLVIDPNATSSTNYNATRTAPNLQIKISDIVPAANPNDAAEIRVWAMLTTTNQDADFENVGIGLTKFQSNDMSYISARGMSGGSLRNFSLRHALGVTLEVNHGTAHNTKDVFVLRWRGADELESYLGASEGGAFPAASSLTLIGVMAMGAAAQLANGSELAFLFNAFPANTSNSFRAALKKFRVEYRP